jgi:glycerol-3-phosphate dehydrogenase (NAD(P)+)
MKNIIAIQSGMYEARSCGQNAKSALIAQGLKEIMLLSKALGGKLETLCEPAIVGDLMLSCHSAKSRNMKFGYELAIAHDARQFIQNYPYLLEGTLSVNLILELAKKYDLDLPITKEVAHILTI